MLGPLVSLPVRFIQLRRTMQRAASTCVPAGYGVSLAVRGIHIAPCATNTGIKYHTYKTTASKSYSSKAGNPLSVVAPQEVLDFWFQAGTNTFNGPLWFGSSAQIDELVKEKFGATVEAALKGDLKDWEEKPKSLLAEVVLLDQFTRMIYRGKPEAFSGDSSALALCKKAISDTETYNKAYATMEKVFLLVPFMHSEKLVDHDEGISHIVATQKYVEAQGDEGGAKSLGGVLKFAEEHRVTVARFGRYPHRNKAMGRETTPEEVEYLESANRYGQ
eukprot:comp20918_c0_seq1/m.27902 comp20918_c0_seq1/g.27902  ORF comp20918_c0_seq1/g.27902 comp20918_c0_seq1/m.27902 type:complete len:275 (-) comp20918_c0_seq1:657-1481(-)